MSGAEIRELRLALGIPLKALARELCLTPQTVQVTEKRVNRLTPASESAYMGALTALAKRAAEERGRAKTAELLELVAVD